MANDIIDDIIENAIIEEEEQISSTPTMMSQATTILDKVRKSRSCIGKKRQPYNYDESNKPGRPGKPRNPVGRPRKIVEDTQAAKVQVFKVNIEINLIIELLN